MKLEFDYNSTIKNIYKRISSHQNEIGLRNDKINVIIVIDINYLITIDQPQKHAEGEGGKSDARS
jgi:hypothetical protein